MDDSDILELFFARSERAVAELDAKYGRLFHALAGNILADERDAAECVNDAYLGAWNAIPPERPDRLAAYICRIVRNLSISRYRARRSQKRGEGMEVLLSELEDCVPAVPSTEEAWENREIAAVIDRWLDGLEREDRVIFLRRYWYGQRVDELAALWSCTPNRMAQRLFRLRGGLRRALEEEGVSL